MRAIGRHVEHAGVRFPCVTMRLTCLARAEGRWILESGRACPERALCGDCSRGC